MEIHDEVMKLVGRVSPVGETHADNERYKNLKTLTKLVEQLIYDIQIIANNNKERSEFSMARAGKYCDYFLTELGLSDFDMSCPDEQT